MQGRVTSHLPLIHVSIPKSSREFLTAQLVYDDAALAFARYSVTRSDWQTQDDEQALRLSMGTTDC